MDRRLLRDKVMQGRMQPKPATFACIAYISLQCAGAGNIAAQQGAPLDTLARTANDTTRPKPVPQRDIWDVVQSLMGKSQDTTPQVPLDSVKSAILILPSFGYTPTAGVSFGASLSYVGRLGPASTTRLSQANVGATYSTAGQLNISLTPTLYFPGNRFAAEGDIRYIGLNQFTYGLGPLRPDSEADDMGLELFRTYITGYVSVAQSLYLGPTYRLDYYYGINDRSAGEGQPSAFLEYNGGEALAHTTASGAGLSLVYESRDNPINASSGYYGRADLLGYPTWLGNVSGWSSFLYDFRTYLRPTGSRHTILAFWTFGWFTTAHPPYLNLPAIGWDRYEQSGRGYLQGQIRAPNMFYGEVELRQQITADGLIGAVAFANVTAANTPNTSSFTPLNPGFGPGLRIKLNKKSDQNIRVDIGFTPRGPARVYLGSGEAF